MSKDVAKVLAAIDSMVGLGVFFPIVRGLLSELDEEAYFRGHEEGYDDGLAAAAMKESYDAE